MGNTCCLLCGCVDQATVGVVERWGRFEKLAEPGLHFFNPLAGQWLAGVLSTRIRSLDVRIETKTKDNVFVQLLCSIQYRVIKENADDAFYELQNPQEQIQAYVFDVVRAVVPKMTLDGLFEQKGEVAKAVLEELEKVMGAYGYSIEHILMVDIIPDASVRKAMNEINAAQRLQLASVYKGEAEKVLQIKKAEAEAEAKYLGGVGVARQRQAITDGLRENILNFSHKVEGTSAKEVMDLIMVTQYFDTIKDLGNSSKNTTVFIPHGPGHVRDIGDQIRNGMMEAATSALALSWSHNKQFDQALNYEGSSDLVNLEYHMGPVLASPIKLYVIWYGHWNPTHQATIRDFLYSLSSSSSYPSVADWWRTVRLYTDQTGSNITGSIVLSGEFYDSKYSHGGYLSRLAIQSVIRTAVNANPRALPLNPHNGLYLVLTSPDVRVQDFCRAVCGFHYFTFPNIVGVTVPYAWVGHSGTQCPGVCAYPFAWPKYSGRPPPSTNGGNNIMRAPNGDAGADGMISVIAHELAEVSSNPLVNAWYAGDDPTAPTEIADLCMGVYGTGGGGGYVGKVYRDSWGSGYNVNGVKGRRFLVQWVWNPVKKRCFGPNAAD